MRHAHRQEQEQELDHKHEHEPADRGCEPQPDAAEAPRIYVASLADYNAGRLLGRWIDADQDTDDIRADIAAMLATSSEPIAEEWAIHDQDGFGPLRLSEYEDIAAVARLANGIGKNGEALAHWAAYLGSADPDELDRFDDAYLGHWPSITAYAEDLLDDCGVDSDDFAPQWLRSYVRIDTEAFAHDLSFDLHVSEGDEGVYLFQL